MVHSRLTAYQGQNDSKCVEEAVLFLRLAEHLGVDLEMWDLQNLLWVLLTTTTEHNDVAAPAICELAGRFRFSDSIVDSRLKRKRGVSADP